MPWAGCAEMGWGCRGKHTNGVLGKPVRPQKPLQHQPKVLQKSRPVTTSNNKAVRVSVTECCEDNRDNQPSNVTLC